MSKMLPQDPKVQLLRSILPRLPPGPIPVFLLVSHVDALQSILKKSMCDF